MPRLGAIEKPTGDDHLRRKATVLRCGKEPGELRDGAAAGAHLGVAVDELACTKGEDVVSAVVGEEWSRGGGLRRTADLELLAATCEGGKVCVSHWSTRAG